jgi:hypothetical protein
MLFMSMPTRRAPPGCCARAARGHAAAAPSPAMNRRRRIHHLFSCHVQPIAVLPAGICERCCQLIGICSVPLSAPSSSGAGGFSTPARRSNCGWPWRALRAPFPKRSSAPVGRRRRPDCPVFRSTILRPPCRPIPTAAFAREPDRQAEHIGEDKTARERGGQREQISCEPASSPCNRGINRASSAVGSNLRTSSEVLEPVRFAALKPAPVIEALLCSPRPRRRPDRTGAWSRSALRFVRLARLKSAPVLRAKHDSCPSAVWPLRNRMAGPNFRASQARRPDRNVSRCCTDAPSSPRSAGGRVICRLKPRRPQPGFTPWP